MSEDSKRDRSAAPRWAVPAAIMLQCVGLAACISAPALGSWALAWVGAIYLAGAWLIEWAGCMTARRNLKEMPLFGHGEIEADPSDRLPPVTLIAAARNEERSIEAAARSMAAMEYPDFEIMFVDDHSTDATPRILDSLAEAYKQVRVFHNPPMQIGWAGKQNAVWHAVKQVNPDREWLLFTDADIMFGPTILRDAVLFAEREKIDFMTCIPQVETDSLFEELALVRRWAHHLECFQYAKLNDGKTTALGIGAFLLVRRDAYLAAGGHAAIAADLSDDAALARLLKKSGATIGFSRAGDQLRCHQYYGLRETMRNLVRKQRIACHDRYGAYVSTMLYALVQLILPLPLALACIAVQIAGGRFSVALTMLAASAFGLYVQGVRSFSVARAISRIHSISPFLHPVCGILRVWLTSVAMLRKASGRGLEWRGREIGLSDRS